MPKKPRAAVANEGVVSPSSPRGPQTVSPEDFFRLAAEYPNKSATAIYIYRLWPVIRRHPKNIEKCLELTPEKLKQRWGNGLYQLRFTDSNRKPIAEAFNCKYEIDDPQIEPVVNFAELDRGADKNRAYIENLIARGELKPEGEDVTDNTAATAAVTEVAGLARSVLEKQDQGENTGAILKAVQVLQDVQSKAAAGSDPVAKLKELTELLRAMQPASAANAGGEVSALLKMMIEDNRELRRMMLEQRTNAAPPTDPIEHLERSAGLLEKLGARFGGGGGGGFDWNALVTAAAPLLLQLLMRVPPVPPGTAPPMPAPVSLPSSAANPEIIPPARPATSESSEVFDMANPMFLLGLVRKLGPVARAAFERGASGGAFAAALDDGFVCDLGARGQEVYEALTSMGPEQLATIITAAVPDLAAHAERLKAWLGDFCSYGADPEPATTPAETADSQ